MEDSKKLVAELQAKLAELDSKVANYRQDMLVQFIKFSDDLLKGVPEDVSNEVSRVIQESMSQYPSLKMPSHDKPESPATPIISEAKPPRDGCKSPPPILHHTSGVPKTPQDVPRGPHDREKEFHGLFTPTYLPLLDGNDRPAPQQRSDPTLKFRKNKAFEAATGLPFGSPIFAPPSDDPDEDVAQDEEMAEVEEVEDAETAGKGKGKEVVRPAPARAPTDVSVASSAGSSSSETKPRRSALRRSSSSTKGSPRRVRFEFAGTEVLPTASPQESESILENAGDVDESESSSAVDDSLEDYTGPSLSDVEGEEDNVPRPPRISSTEALRRLTRTPPEEGTFWTVVNANNETPPEFTNGYIPRADDNRPTTSGVAEEMSASAAITSPTSAPVGTASGSESPLPHEVSINGRHVSHDIGSTELAPAKETDEEDSHDEMFLAIKSPKAPSPSSRSPLARSPLTGEPSTMAIEAHRAAPSSTDKDKGKQKDIELHEEQEGLFDFDDPSISGAAPARAGKYLPEEEEEDDTVMGDAAGDDDEGEEAEYVPQPSAYSASPAISVPKQARNAAPSPPTPSRPAFESIGSYKGAPLRMSVVTNAKIQEEAAALGDVKTYVGSVHGRTGIDPADESSYRASFSNAKLFSGTPRSFSERLMLEEAMELDEKEELD